MNSPPHYDVPTLKAKLLEKLGPQAASYPQQIEQRYPRILAKLVELWGSDALEPYVNQLVFSDRTERQGFPHDVATELFRLSAALDALGLTKPPSGTGWESAEWNLRHDVDGLKRH